MRVSHVRHDVRAALARRPAHASLEAQRRYTLMKAVAALALSVPVRTACAELGLAPATFYRWAARLKKGRVEALEPSSRRSRSPRDAWAQRLVRERVEKLRKDATTNKDALAALLQRAGVTVSASTVGRVLRNLIRRGVIERYTPRPNARPASPRPPRPHAVRTPKRLTGTATAPGDVIQIDTLPRREPVPSWRHFTAVDIVSRTTRAQLHASGRAVDALSFLAHLLETSPFPVRALQVDQGSEFKDAFEDACLSLGITLFENHARTPKQNAFVERLQRTYRDEFYRRVLLPSDLHLANELLQRYVHHHNHHRPHAGLRYLTPSEYLGLQEPAIRLR
jgi:transposase InsO family protein